MTSSRKERPTKFSLKKIANRFQTRKKRRNIQLAAGGGRFLPSFLCRACLLQATIQNLIKFYQQMWTIITNVQRRLAGVKIPVPPPPYSNEISIRYISCYIAKFIVRKWSCYKETRVLFNFFLNKRRGGYFTTDFGLRWEIPKISLVVHWQLANFCYVGSFLLGLCAKVAIAVLGPPLSLNSYLAVTVLTVVQSPL